MDNPLQNFNISLFRKINHDWTNSFFDIILPLIRESIVWTPLYLFLIIFAYYNFGKKGLYWVLAAIVTAIISNFISSDIIKPFFNQLRPCRETMLEPSAILRINRCPSSGSFTSSHATNHFAVATFLFVTLRHIVKWTGWFFVWAAVICYAQVYVGVHYPIDVIYGGALGSFIGYVMAKLYNYKIGVLSPSKQIN